MFLPGLKRGSIKNLLFASLILKGAAYSFGQAPVPAAKDDVAAVSILPDMIFRTSNFISLEDAEGILGQPVHLSDSSLKRKADYTIYKFNYRGNSVDSIACTRIELSFGFEEYSQLSYVAGIYDAIKTECRKNSSVKNLEVGEEGFLSIDAWNFPSIIIKKKNRLFKFWLSHVTDKRSLSNLQLAASKIVSSY